MAALLKKCSGVLSDGSRCADRWACARYYVPAAAAGYLDGPRWTPAGCLDFLRLSGALHPPGRNHGVATE